MVRFDGAAAILVYKSERDLGRVSKLPRGGERSWEAAGKIGRENENVHCKATAKRSGNNSTFSLLQCL